MESEIRTDQKLNDIRIERSPFIVTDDVVELFCKGYNGKPPWYELYSSKQTRQKLERLQQIEGSEMYSLRIGDELAGFAILTDNFDSSSNSRFVQELVVDPRFQRSQYRVGSRIIEQVIDDARSENIDNLQLQTDLRNRKAIALYSKFGFIPDEEVRAERPMTRTFCLSLTNSFGDSEQNRIALSTLVPYEDVQIFTNQRELQRFLVWNWLVQANDSPSPEVPDDWNKYQAVLQPLIAKALESRLLARGSYSSNENSIALSASNYGFPVIWGNEATLQRVAKLAGFLMSLQSLSTNKISSRDMDKIIDSCLDSARTIGRRGKTNFVGFVCASYEEDFAGVSESTQTNRLRFVSDTLKQLERQLLEMDADIKITLLFADTDYEIYPIEPTEINLANYRRQFDELRQYCDANFDPRVIRILPWSRYRNFFSTAYFRGLETASPLAKQKVRGIPNLSDSTRQMRATQQADYAAQAAMLPPGTILLILEDPNLSPSYDLLFPPKDGLAKVSILDPKHYREWTRRDQND